MSVERWAAAESALHRRGRESKAHRRRGQGRKLRLLLFDTNSGATHVKDSWQGESLSLVTDLPAGQDEGVSEIGSLEGPRMKGSARVGLSMGGA